MLFLLLALCFTYTLPIKLPSNFKRCKVKENDFQECLRSAIEDAVHQLKTGLPNFNLPPIDPLIIPSVTIVGETGAVNLVQKYKNFTTYGFGGVIVEKIDANLDKNYINFNFTIKNAVVEAKYDFNGKILLLPIQGNGPCRITFGTVKQHHKITFEKYRKKDNEEYMKAINYTVIVYGEKIHYRFDNLFNGDIELGKTINQVINDNSEEIFADVKDGYGKTYAAVFKDYTNKIFSRVPLKDIFDYD